MKILPSGCYYVGDLSRILEKEELDKHEHKAIFNVGSDIYYDEDEYSYTCISGELGCIMIDDEIANAIEGLVENDGYRILVCEDFLEAFIIGDNESLVIGNIEINLTFTKTLIDIIKDMKNECGCDSE